MQKIYVLDTNVILHSADSILKFEEHIVVIPQTVLTELDTKKTEKGELGYNARQFSRLVDELRLKGNLTKGVKLNDDGGMFYISLYNSEVGNFLQYQDMSVLDNRILATALHEQALYPDKEVVLVTKDSNMRILADVFGMKAEDYKNSKVKTDETFIGVSHVEVEQILIDRIYVQKSLPLADIFSIEDEPYPHECFVFHSTANTKQSALARYDFVMKTFNLLPQDMKTCDILPRNLEQQFALDILKDSSINLVTLEGLAGSGKTLLALAAGLYGVLETQQYAKILLLKPIVPMDGGHEIGFLPGSMEEKLGPWMASYGDNIEQIMSKYIKEDDAPKKKKSKKEEETYQEKSQGKTNPIQELIAHGLLEFGSLEHIRGRSLPNQYIIIDEAQGLTKHAIRTIITRIGEGSKIVIMGDASQIDSPYLDSKSNGLSICVEAFKPVNIAAHIKFSKSERSQLAEIASQVL